MRRFHTLIIIAAGACIALRVDVSRAALYAAQPDTGKILEVDPATGTILRWFSAPDPSFTLVGFSGAEGGATLIWQDITGALTQGRITRVDPLTGSVLDDHAPLFRSGDVRGLTAQSVGGTTYIVSGGSGDPAIAQHGYDSLEYNPINITATIRTLGGDDHGRSFAGCFDQTVYTIREFDPVTGNELHSFAFGAPITGLAFDGQYLYAAANEVQGVDLVSRIYTLNPDSGATVRSAILQGSPVTELGVAVPEASRTWILAMAAMAYCHRHRRSSFSAPSKT